MATSLCNLLGPLCTTYRFGDGSTMRRSSRETITYEYRGVFIHIGFYYNGSDRYEYYLPENIADKDRANLTRKIEEYCKRKRYKIVNGSSQSAQGGLAERKPPP
jgi:hypothetical protein